MRALALIPARAGSKRLPGKNRETIGGMNLVRIAVQHALESEVIATIAVSTDDRDILQSGPPLYLIDRPVALATDATPMIEVVRHALRYFLSHTDERYDAVVLLQPTSPLRAPADIRAAMALMKERKADAVISVVDTRNPEVYTIGHADRLRSVSVHVDGRRLVVPNGAIFIISVDALDRGLDWWTAPLTYAYEMPKERSVDIDTYVDLELARSLWRP